MSQHTWLIGSASDCDIVVDHTTVSGHHCRLTEYDSQLRIEDLNSTNGTYVNGSKIDNSQSVALTDQITLGHQIPMPWPDSLQSNFAEGPDKQHKSVPQDQSVSPEKIVITIGRDASNSVVLQESNVSSFHAKLTLESNSIRLDDLGSTNGTSVRNVENKINSANVSIDDTIFLGSKSYQVADLIQQAGVNVEQFDRTSPVTFRTTNISRPTAILASVGTLLLIAVSLMIFRGDSENDQKATPLSPQPSSPAGPSQAVSGNANDETATQLPNDSQEALTNVELPFEEVLVRSLFMIIATDPEEKTSFRVGTGFAIGPQRIVTSGSVISMLRDLEKNGFSQSYLVNLTIDQKLPIESFELHPHYQQAHLESLEARKDYETLLQQHNVEEPSSALPEPVLSQLSSLRDTALAAIERKTSSDIAIIETQESLIVWLKLADSDSSLRPKLKVRVLGMAFDFEDPFFDPELSTDPVLMESRINKLVRINPDAPPRLLVKGTSQQQEWAFYGSPVLNPNDEVIAVYSRSTPTSENEESDSSSETFDAPLVSRVRECLQLTKP